MLGTPAIRNLLREAKVPQITSMIQMGSKVGMMLMRDSLNRLFENGEISAETLRELLISGSQTEEETSAGIPGLAAGNRRPSSSSSSSF